MRFKSWLSRPSMLRALASRARLAFRLLREPAVPLLVKALPVLAGAYVVSPIDAIPDFIVGLGQLDDLTVLIVALEAFVRWCPSNVVSHHLSAIQQGRRYQPMRPDGTVIDAEFRRDAR